MDTVFNKKGTTYRRLHLNFDQMSEKEKFDNLLNEQSMIKRPLIENNGKYHVGFDEQAIEKFIK